MYVHVAEKNKALSPRKFLKNTLYYIHMYMVFRQKSIRAYISIVCQNPVGNTVTTLQ